MANVEHVQFMVLGGERAGVAVIKINKNINDNLSYIDTNIQGSS